MLLIRKHWVLPVVLLISGCIVFLLWTIYGPQTITSTYGSTTHCIRSPRFFPALATGESKGAFQINRPVRSSVGSIPFFASHICAHTVTAPAEHSSANYREKLFGLSFMSRQITVTTPAYPHIQTSKDIMMPPDRPLTLSLDTSDAVFSYAAIHNNMTAGCVMKVRQLQCDLTPLQLTYAQTYVLELVRTYKGQPSSSLGSLQLQTITPLTVVTASIAANSVVQESPKQFTIVTDKPLQTVGTVQLISKSSTGIETAIPLDTVIADKNIIVTLGAVLARKTNFEIRISDFRATDSSGMIGNAYRLVFTTSGGPRVRGASIGTRDVGLNQSISLTFDQTLLATQDLASQVIVKVNGIVQPLTPIIANNTITLRPAAFPLCATITVTATAAIQNQYGIAGDSAWSMTARARCYITSTIGTSVKGRPITAYRFGSGNSTILYMGAMHGNEANTKRLMDEWMAELNHNPDRIPSTHSLVIIPSVNPDGVASGTRFNARNVDLNRNFPANDWKSVVTTPQSSQPTAAGGPNPLSEPESQAIAHYIGQLSPRLVLSFHSKAAVVEANEAGFSVGVAAVYAAGAQYRAIPHSQSAGVFQYDTTGAMEDWLRDTAGRPAIVVELASSDSSEFTRNRDALWQTVGL